MAKHAAWQLGKANKKERERLQSLHVSAGVLCVCVRACVRYYVFMITKEEAFAIAMSYLATLLKHVFQQ